MDDWTLCTGDFLRDRWALSPDGKRVSLRTRQDGRELAVFDVTPRSVTALMAFSPGGRWLAMRHREELGVWPVAPDAAVSPAFIARAWPQGTPFGFMKAAFAPDDSAVLYNDGADLLAVALPGGTELARWPAAPCGALAFAPDGKSFAAALQSEPVVELRAWPGGETVQRFAGRVLRPQVALALSSAGWIAGGDNDGRVTVWRADGPLRYEFTGHTAGIRGMTFSPDGRHLASAGEDGTVRVWDCAAGAAVTSVAWDSALPSFSRDGRLLGSGSAAGHLVQAELTLSPLLGTFRPPAEVERPQQLSFAPDSRSLLCLSDDAVYRCAVPDGAPLASWPLARAQTVLAAADELMFAGGPDGIARWQNAAAGKDGAPFLPAVRWGWDSLGASADGRWIAAADNAGTRAAVWPAASGSADGVRFLPTEEGTGDVALSPDGSHAAVAHRYEPGLMVYDVSTASIMHRLELPPRHNVAWSPDGRWLAANGTVTRLWDTATWQEHPLPALPDNHPPAAAAAFAWPDKTGAVTLLAVATGSSRIALIRLPRGEPAAVLTPPAELPVYRLAFSRDGSWLGASTARGEVQLWKLSEIPDLR